MHSNLVRSISLGLRRRSRRGATAALGAIGTIWLLTEIGMAASSALKIYFDAHHPAYLLGTGFAAFATFLWYIYEPSVVSFIIPTTATTVRIKFGDLFDETDDLLIAVNEFFDHSLGQVVSPTSVHGGFIQREFNSDENRFRQTVDASLVQYQGEAIARAIQPSTRYPIGTTALVPIGGRRAYLFVFTKTDLVSAKASASVEMLWVALAHAWKAIHDFGNGRSISLPLIGNGRSSLNLEPQHLLRLLTLSLVDFARKTGLPNEVTIVVPDACFEQLDIREIARDWKRA